LLIACCILAATALPKPHHNPSKLVHAVEQDLDENDDADVLVEDSPALEEESDAQPADDEVDMEEHTQLEEEDEATAKVNDDIANLQQALEESELAEDIREQASANLDKISEDVREMKSAAPSRASQLKEAIHKRLQAFHMMVQEQDEEGQEDERLEEDEEDEEDAVTKVANDVTQLEEAISSSAMASSDKKAARKNLEAIAHDAQEFSEATSAKSKSLFKQAIAKRMQALHLMLEESHEEHHVDADKVLADVRHMQAAVKSAHLQGAVKKAVRENLSVMLKDAEEMASSSGATASRLSKALKLRSRALRQQLEEDN